MASTVEAELYITSIIQNTPRAMIRPDSAWNMAGSELSINSLVAPNDYPSGKLFCKKSSFFNFDNIHHF